MRKIKLGVFFCCLLLLTSSKQAQKALIQDIIASKLIFVGEVQPLKKNKVKFSVINAIFAKRKSYILNYRNIWSSNRLPGRSGRYLVLVKRDKKNIRGLITMSIFRVINNQVLITEPYLYQLSKNGLKQKMTFEEEFDEYLVINKKRNVYGFKIKLDDFIKIIIEVKKTKTLSKLKEKYEQGTFEHSLLNSTE